MKFYLQNPKVHVQISVRIGYELSKIPWVLESVRLLDRKNSREHILYQSVTLLF